jgi:hypothetical protein
MNIRQAGLNGAAHFFVIGAFLLVNERAGFASEPLQLRAPVAVFVGLVTAIVRNFITLVGAMFNQISLN